MKILTVCSGLDFINYTRRATIEAIHKKNPELDILMFNSILNIRKRKIVSDSISFFNYHFWIVEKIRNIKFLVFTEYFLRYFKWHGFFCQYEAVFLIDPNQYYLLPYISKKQKLIYLLRDPSVLMNPNDYEKESKIIERADLILGISNGLCTYYFEKYYKYIPSNVKLWPNTADLELWNWSRWRSSILEKRRPLIGLAGNTTYVIDIELLLFAARNLPDFDFEIAGKISVNDEEMEIWETLVKLPNVKHLGLVPFNDFPGKVINWDIGLVAAKKDHEFARYLNNNKQYQYLALGKPFVTFRLNADYDDFEDMVFIAEDKWDYLIKIRLAINKSYEKGIIEKGSKIAARNSAEARAESFLSYLKEM